MATKTRAGILYAGVEFVDSANAARRYLKSKGFTVYTYELPPIGLAVEDLPRLLGPLDVLIWYSHGGWDGPIIFDDAGDVDYQVSWYEREEWKKLTTYFTDQMKPHGLFISHACHSAGSNKYELADTPSLIDRWVEDIATDMNVFTVGVEGSTAAANRTTAVKLLSYALYGSRPPQASRAYLPGGKLAAKWKGWAKARLNAPPPTGTELKPIDPVGWTNPRRRGAVQP